MILLHNQRASYMEGDKNQFNTIQQAAFELIQSDARFLYTLTKLQQECKQIESNYIMMSQPYIGLFVDGSDKWSKKMRMAAPQLSAYEKRYYTHLRQGHKLFEKPYIEIARELNNSLIKADCYFRRKRGLYGLISGYSNVGVDICNGKYCGNTLICDNNMPFDIFDSSITEENFMEISIIAGKLAAYYNCISMGPYTINSDCTSVVVDYHFFRRNPLKTNDYYIGVTLFSIICSINFITTFLETVFTEEVPQKYKFAYLLYYYLCDFIKDLNYIEGTHYKLDDSFKNRELRNCLAHYGIGQFLAEQDIDDSPLKGLIMKAFNLDYNTAKKQLFDCLDSLCNQITNDIIM